MQTRKWSLIESLTNVGIGFGISLVAQLVIFRYYGIALDLGSNVAITLWFTGISIVRGYMIRRMFVRLKR